MEEFKGIKLKEFPFENLEKVGLVLFHEFPAIRIYQTPEHRSILVEWIDCSDEGLDRYIAYESFDMDLIHYLKGKLSHYNLIKLAVRSMIVAFEGSLSEIMNPRLVTFNDLAGDYLPDQDVFLDKGDIVEHEKIAAYVAQLQKHAYPVYEYASVSVAERAPEYSSESVEEFSLTIKFTALDIVAGTYSFFEEGQKYSGQFDALVHTTELVALNFIDSFTVNIKRITQNTRPGQAPVIIDLIVSLIKKP